MLEGLIFKVLFSLLGHSFLGWPMHNIASGMAVLAKSFAGCYGAWACLQAPQLVSRESRIRAQMLKAFQAAKIYNVHKRRDYGDGQIKDYLEYPRINCISSTDQSISVTFRLPPGFNPKVLEERAFVFQQIFGPHAQLVMGSNVYQLEVTFPLPKSVPYSYPLIEKAFRQTGGLPVFAGIDESGEPVCYDMRQKPHLGVVGVTGFGKSSYLRVLLCSWLQFFGPEQIRLYLGDLKKTEFQQYHGVPHVDRIAVARRDVVIMLREVVQLMDQRSALLGRAGATNLEQYQKKMNKSLPIVVVCIDEVALLQKEKAAHECLDEIGAIGRALGVFLILSQQRADSEVLGGRLKNNLTVRMAYRMSDALNSRMFLDSDAAAQLAVPGRAIVKEPDRMSEVQTPWLSEEDAEVIIDRFRVSLACKDSAPTDPPAGPPTAIFDDVVFGEVAAKCERVT